MKLIYWKAKCLTDDDCYSVRAKTRKECVEIIEGDSYDSYSKPYKVEIEYDSGFDLMLQAQTEGGLAEDANWDIEGSFRKGGE